MIHAAALAYICLLLAADGVAWGDADRPRPVHWVAYGACSPWAAVVGKLLSLWHVVAFLTATSLPLIILAHGASPVELRRVWMSAMVAFASLTLVGLVGLFIGSLSSDRATRLIGVDAVSLGIAALLFLFGARGDGPEEGLFFYLNPAKILSYLLEPGRGEASGVSWPIWLTLHSTLALLAAYAAVRGLRAWRRQPPPGQGSLASSSEPREGSKGAS